MKEFLQYFIKSLSNWLWALGSILIFIDFVSKGIPMFNLLAFIPFTLLVYTFVDEYQAYIWSKTGARKLSAKLLINIVSGLVTLDLIIVILLLFINN